MSQGVVKILEERVNKLIPREELVVEFTHMGTGTPSRQQIAESIRSILNLPSSKVVIVRKALTAYGSYVTRAFINIYDSLERAKAFEPKYILKRNGLIQEQQAPQQSQ